VGDSSSENKAFEVLRLARTHVRSRTRTSKYMEHADRFSEQFLGRPLGVDPDYCRALGTDATVIDFYYEHLVSEGESAMPLLRQTTSQLQEMVDTSLACRSLPALQKQLSAPSCSLLDVARGILASITTLGYASLSRRVSPGMADHWATFWQEYVWKQNRQQELHCGLCLVTQSSENARPHVLARLNITPAELRPRSTTFADGVREYLASFSETGALAVALIGSLAFAQRLPGEGLAELIGFLKATPELLAQMTGLLRLAQDVHFDPAEPVSTGVAALAAERGVSLVDLDARQLPIAELEARLQREWGVYSRECYESMATILASLPGHGRIQETLTDLVKTICYIADVLTKAPHKDA
jgi:hypothetical protein